MKDLLISRKNTVVQMHQENYTDLYLNQIIFCVRIYGIFS